MAKLTITQLLNMPPTVDLMTAAEALGLGRTKAYDLAKHDEFPCRVIRIGETYRIPTAGLLRLLGITDVTTASGRVRVTAGTSPTELSRAG